jgi:hypothetical protein
MKRYDLRLAIALVLSLSGLVLLTPANAAPPTVTPSPGYDARLQEQRDAARISPVPRPVHRRRLRRVHGQAE